MIVHPAVSPVDFISCSLWQLVITKLLFNMHVSPTGLTTNLDIFIGHVDVAERQQHLRRRSSGQIRRQAFPHHVALFLRRDFRQKIIKWAKRQAHVGPGSGDLRSILCSIFWINTKFSAGSERDMLRLVTNLALILLGASLLQSFDPRVHLNSLLTWMGRNTLRFTFGTF